MVFVARNNQGLLIFKKQKELLSKLGIRTPLSNVLLTGDALTVLLF